MIYEFMNEECELCDMGCLQKIEIPISQAPNVGEVRECPVEGCCQKVMRILSSDQMIVVKGNGKLECANGQTVRMNIEGQDTRLKFIDHKQTKPEFANQLKKLAGGSGVTEAYYNEKHGRMCVDVESSMKDPLGAYEKSKQGCDRTTVKHDVKQKFKVRGKN